MTERRAWTPERVHRLLNILQELTVAASDLAAAELRVGDILEKALDVGKREAALEGEE